MVCVPCMCKKSLKSSDSVDCIILKNKEYLGFISSIFKNHIRHHHLLIFFRPRVRLEVVRQTIIPTTTVASGIMLVWCCCYSMMHLREEESSLKLADSTRAEPQYPTPIQKEFSEPRLL